MRAIRAFMGTGILVLVALLLASAGTVPSVDAATGCTKVSGSVTLQPATGPDCTSPIGVCSTGKFKGDIKGSFYFTASAFIPSADTPTTGVVFVTGDNVIHTDHGDLFAKDATVLSTGGGESAEIETITGGTGDYTGAKGVLQVTGRFSGDRGTSSYAGQLCIP